MSEELDCLGEEGVIIPHRPGISPESRSDLRTLTAVKEVSLEMHNPPDAHVQRKESQRPLGQSTDF